MASYFNQAEWAYMGTLDTSGANTLDWVPGGPVDVKRILLVVTTAMTTASPVLTIGKRDADLATNSETYATVTVTYTLGADGAQFVIDFPAKTAAETAGSDGPFIDQTDRSAAVVYRTPGLLHIDFGQELFITSAGEGDAGVSAVYVEYMKQGLNDIHAPDVNKLVATLA